MSNSIYRTLEAFDEKENSSLLKGYDLCNLAEDAIPLNSITFDSKRKVSILYSHSILKNKVRLTMLGNEVRVFDLKTRKDVDDVFSLMTNASGGNISTIFTSLVATTSEDLKRIVDITNKLDSVPQSFKEIDIEKLNLKINQEQVFNAFKKYSDLSKQPLEGVIDTVKPMKAFTLVKRVLFMLYIFF